MGHEKCPHYAVISSIIGAIDCADGVVFVSSVYMMRETSLLKNLFDHLLFMAHRPYFFRSKALILTTAGGVGGMSAARGIGGTLKAIGFNCCYLFGCSSFSWNDYLPKEKIKRALGKITGRFVADVLSKKLHAPSCLVLIPYNLFRGMSLAYVKGSEYETLDGTFWTEDCRKNGVYDGCVGVPFYKKPIGHFFYVVGKLAGKRILVTYKKSGKLV